MSHINAGNAHLASTASDSSGVAQGICSDVESPTVFIIDDDASMRGILCELVETAGLRSEGFADARHFVETFDCNRPGCIILDTDLPGITGIDLYRQLISQPICPPVVFLTGSGDISLAMQAMRMGAVDFIQKPFQKEALTTCVLGAIARDRVNRREHAAKQELERRRAELTARECEVMGLLAAGQSTKGIASRLGISSKTVDKHRAKVLNKMRVDNPIELAHLLLGNRIHIQLGGRAHPQGLDSQ